MIEGLVAPDAVSGRNRTAAFTAAYRIWKRRNEGAKVFARGITGSYRTVIEARNRQTLCL